MLSSLAALVPTKLIPTSFFKLVCSAELILVGQISEVESSTYTLAVEQHVHGPPAAESVEITRFKNWMCAGRWQTYTPGERLVVFLQRDGKIWKAIGGGCEGELPVVSGRAIASDGIAGHPVTKLDRRTWPAVGAGGGLVSRRSTSGWPRVGSGLPVHELIAAVQQFHVAFQVRPLKARATEVAIEALRASSPTARHLVWRASLRCDWRPPRPTWTDGAAHGWHPVWSGADETSSHFDPVAVSVGPEGNYFGVVEGERCHFFNRSANGALSELAQAEEVSRVVALGDRDADGQSEWLVILGNVDHFVPTDVELAHALVDSSGEWTTRPIELDRGPGSDASVLGRAIAPIPTAGECARFVIGQNRDPFVEKQLNARGVHRLFDVTIEPDGRIVSASVVPTGREVNIRALADVGDLDGDGVRELAIGWGWGLGLPHEGSLSIAFRESDGSIRSLVDVSRSTCPLLGSLYPNDAFGASLASIADLDGDGLRELAVGVPYEDGSGPGLGGVRILFLGPDGRPRDVRRIAPGAGGFPYAFERDARFGSSLAAGHAFDGRELVVHVHEGRGGRSMLWSLELDETGTVLPPR